MNETPPIGPVISIVKAVHNNVTIVVVSGFIKTSVILNPPNISTKAHVPSRTNTTNNGPGVLLMPPRLLVQMNRPVTRKNRKLSKTRPGTLEIKCDVKVDRHFPWALAIPETGK